MSEPIHTNSFKSNLFIIWLVTLVFGANLLPISLPGFTIYFNLVLGVLLFFVLFSALSFKEGIFSLKYGLSVFALLVLGGVSIVTSEGREEAIFTFRGLLMFALTVSNLILAFNAFGKKSFLSYLRIGLWYYFGITVVFGILEYSTGIHFAGNHTQKLLELPVSMTTYAPTFLWDNPNTYITFIAITAISLLLVDRTIQGSIWKQMVLLGPIFFFSVVSDSIIGMMISGILGLTYLSIHLKSIFKAIRPSILILLVSGVSMLATVLLNDIYWGPKWLDGEKYRLNGVTAVSLVDDDINILSKEELLTHVNEDTLIKRLHDNVHHGLSSFTLRKNLIANGIEFWKQNPIIGIGAGQYRYLIKKGKNKYPVESLTSPHNLAIEVISQFGIVGIIFLVTLMYAFWKMIRKTADGDRVVIIIGSGLVFALVTCLPSSLLIYDCLWLFVGVLIIEAFLVRNDSQTNELN